MESFFMRLLNPALIWVLIPITWLVLTSVVEVLKLAQRHRERMALIQQGIHPDLEEDSSSFEETEPLNPAHRETTGYEVVGK